MEFDKLFCPAIKMFFQYRFSSCNRYSGSVGHFHLYDNYFEVFNLSLKTFSNFSTLGAITNEQ